MSPHHRANSATVILLSPLQAAAKPVKKIRARAAIQRLVIAWLRLLAQVGDDGVGVAELFLEIGDVDPLMLPGMVRTLTT